jgi:hypothetical protein
VCFGWNVSGLSMHDCGVIIGKVVVTGSGPSRPLFGDSLELVPRVEDGGSLR